MKSTFLTTAELIELTGRKQKSKQIKQLQKIRMTYIIDALGCPRVYRESLDKVFGLEARDVRQGAGKRIRHSKNIRGGN